MQSASLVQLCHSCFGPAATQPSSPVLTLTSAHFCPEPQLPTTPNSHAALEPPAPVLVLVLAAVLAGPLLVLVALSVLLEGSR